MKITHDQVTNTVHVALTEYDDVDVARWKGIGGHDVEGDFTFEFDKRGMLLGFEVKFAAQGLPPDFIELAERAAG